MGWVWLDQRVILVRTLPEGTDKLRGDVKDEHNKSELHDGRSERCGLGQARNDIVKDTKTKPNNGNTIIATNHLLS